MLEQLKEVYEAEYAASEIRTCHFYLGEMSAKGSTGRADCL